MDRKEIFANLFIILIAGITIFFLSVEIYQSKATADICGELLNKDINAWRPAGYFSPQGDYYVVFTKGRSNKLINKTDYHEACHSFVKDDYHHFCIESAKGDFRYFCKQYMKK